MPQGAARRARRWLTLAVVAWLTLVLAGREHALQSIGIHLACIHPDLLEPERSGGTTGSGAERGGPVDDDCPPGCPDCACGAAPFVPPAPMATIADRGYCEQDFHKRLVDVGPVRRAAELERPPRRA